MKTKSKCEQNMNVDYALLIASKNFFLSSVFAHENYISQLPFVIFYVSPFQNKAVIKREIFSIKLIKWMTVYSHVKYYFESPVVGCRSDFTKG